MLHIHTPLFDSKIIGDMFGKPVFLKMECYQPPGSFKIRGIGLACERAKASGQTQLVSSSGGNAGLAVAYAGAHLNMPVTVFVPETTPKSMVRKIELWHATVNVAGKVWDEAHEAACQLAEQDSAAYIPPFDLPDIWEGHETLIEELPYQPDAMMVAVGGGGLLLGVLQGLIKRGWQSTQVFTCETHGADSMAQSLQANERITLPAITSIAHSLGAKRVSETAFDTARTYGVQSIVVTDTEAIQACKQFANDHKVLVEPACGAALAPVYDKHPLLNECESVHVVVCGGTGVNLESFCS